MRIAVAAAPTFGNEHAFSRLGEIVKQLAGLIIVDRSAHGNVYLQMLPRASVTIATLTMPAALGTKNMVVAKFQKRILVRIRDEMNVAAVAAITAAGSASRDKLLPPEGNASVTAVAGLDCDFGFVDEHRKQPQKGTKGTKGFVPFCAFCAFLWLYSTGWIEMNLPV